MLSMRSCPRNGWTHRECLANGPFLLINASLDVRPAAPLECFSSWGRWGPSATPAEFRILPAATAAAHCHIPCCFSPDCSWVHLLTVCVSCCSRSHCFNMGFQDSSIKRQDLCWLVQLYIHVFTWISQPRHSPGLQTGIRQGERMT